MHKLLLVAVVVYASAEYVQPKKPAAGVDPATGRKSPFVDGNRLLIDGKVSAWDGESAKVYSPVYDTTTGERIQIGQLAQMGEGEAMAALKAAEKAWDGGQGVWPQMSLGERISAIERLIAPEAAEVAEQQLPVTEPLAAVSLADAGLDTGRPAAPESTMAPWVGRPRVSTVCFARVRRESQVACRGSVRAPVCLRAML